jgi:hypothetical protein
VPGNEFKVPTLNKDEKAVLRNYVDVAKQMKEVSAEAAEARGRLYDQYLDDFTGKLRKDAPGYAKAASEVADLTVKWSDLSDQVRSIENDNWDLLYEKLVNAYQTPRMFTDTPLEEYDPTQFEDILTGRAKPRGNLSFKSGALPFSSSTNRWLDAALKSELIKAAKSDAAWFTLPKGKDVVRVVGGDELGQEKFYEQIVPQRLKKLAKDFLPGEVEIAPIKAKGYGSRADEYDVLGMRLTPEIKKAILEGGFPSFAKGGPVQGSSLDVDVFALQ